MKPELSSWVVMAQWLSAHPVLMVLGPPVAVAVVVAWLSRPGRRPFEQNWAAYWGAYWAAVCAFGAAAFMLLARLMSGQGWLTTFDQALASGLARTLPEGALGWVAVFTALGNRHWLIALAIGLIVWLLWRRQRRMAVFGAIVMGGAGLLTTGFKHALQRVRPEHLHGYALETGWSFPSGHAAGSLAVYAFACVVIMRNLGPRGRRWCLILSATLIGAIGLSRVLLQVHYASDVVAGFALGLAWLALCLALVGPRIMTPAPTRC